MKIETDQLIQIIDDNLEKSPEILGHISKRMNQYLKNCKKENDTKYINALGSACTILSMKRRPSDKDMRKYCILIEKAHFPNGLETWHHTGEIEFYNRFLKNDM